MPHTPPSAARHLLQRRMHDAFPLALTQSAEHLQPCLPFCSHAVYRYNHRTPSETAGTTVQKLLYLSGSTARCQSCTDLLATCSPQPGIIRPAYHPVSEVCNHVARLSIYFCTPDEWLMTVGKRTCLSIRLCLSVNSATSHQPNKH